MAEKSICSVEICGNEVKIKSSGLCQMHHRRFKNHGDPVAGRAFIDVAKKCIVDGCEGKSRLNGLCVKHAARQRRHGDPTSGRTPRNELQKFYDEAVLYYEGDDCLIWPYGKKHNGYGQMRRHGKNVIVSRYLCEDVYGPPPSPDHDSSHSCGNGHLGCVTKGHLSWKTRKDNHADKIEHGTAQRGEKHNMSKLIELEAKEIMALKGVESQRSLAKRFGVTKSAVASIHKGNTWWWLFE